MRIYITISIVVFLSAMSFSQEISFNSMPDSVLTKTGIFGRVVENLDNKSDSIFPLPYAEVAVYQNDVLLTGIISDLEGWFFIPLPSNEIYDLQVSYVGLERLFIPSIHIRGLVEQMVTFTEETHIICGFQRQPCMFYIFFGDGFSSGQTLDARFIRQSAMR